MAYGRDYIPAKDADFDAWFKFLNQYVAKKCIAVPPATTPEWTHIPQAARTEMADAYIAWYSAYVNTSGPHTPVETELKNEARKGAERVIRPFVKQYLMFPPVTPADRRAMGLNEPNPDRSEVHPPETAPELTPDTGTRRRIAIHYRDEGSEHRAKPEHVTGIEIRWSILEAPPAHLKELINSSFDTRSPLVLEFDESDRGSRVYMSGRWEIHREGAKGPFGAIVEAIIP